MSISPPTADWSLVPVRGRYFNFRAQPIEGSLVFSPSATRATDADLLTTIIGLPFSVDLVDGILDTQLPATDDPDITPIEFTYHVKEDFPGGIEYDLAVPMAMVGTGVELAVATAAASSPGTAVPVSARVIAVPVGTTGWATQPDGTLWVEYTP